LENSALTLKTATGKVLFPLGEDRRQTPVGTYPYKAITLTGDLPPGQNERSENPRKKKTWQSISLELFRQKGRVSLLKR